MTNAKVIGIRKISFESDINEIPVKERQVSDYNVKNAVDEELLGLYECRSESAIEKTALHYGSYCTSIAMNILHNKEDAEECVNDTYLKAWNAIPPQRPEVFSSFLGRITRNLSLDKYKSRKAGKRGGDAPTILISELEGCIPSVQNVQNEVEAVDLAKTIEAFLSTMRREDNIFFVRRYFHSETVPAIAERFGVGESKVKVSLHRTRKKLKIELEKRGVTL